MSNMDALTPFDKLDPYVWLRKVSEGLAGCAIYSQWGVLDPQRAMLDINEFAGVGVITPFGVLDVQQASERVEEFASNTTPSNIAVVWAGGREDGTFAGGECVEGFVLATFSADDTGDPSGLTWSLNVDDSGVLAFDGANLFLTAVPELGSFGFEVKVTDEFGAFASGEFHFDVVED